MLSDIVRGLIGVLRGDDGRIYFQMLSHDMKQLELQRLKAQAAKIPPKIRVYSFVMLVCFMLIYIVVILMQILTSMEGCSDEKQMEETLRRGLYRYLCPHPLCHAGDRIGGEGAAGVCGEAAA